MLNFIIGFIVGLITATLIVATLTFFRRVIEHKVTIIEKQIEKVGPKPQGFLIRTRERCRYRPSANQGPQRCCWSIN